MTDWGIPFLHPDCLATIIPTHVYGGGVVSDPEHSLFIWRTARLSTARDMTVGFYVWDEKLEGLWRNPERATARLLTAGVVAVIEPDFSLWADAPLVEQLWSIYRMRTLGRLWQEAGIPLIPNLTWSDVRSFSFAFEGIPVGAPVCITECRTAGQTDDDRRAFLAGLTESVKQVNPLHVIIYGGETHRYWLQDRLPFGPTYHLIDSWTDARGKIRAAQERHARERNQLNLFTGGSSQWVDVEAVAA